MQGADERDGKDEDHDVHDRVEDCVRVPEAHEADAVASWDALVPVVLDRCALENRSEGESHRPGRDDDDSRPDDASVILPLKDAVVQSAESQLRQTAKDFVEDLVEPKPVHGVREGGGDVALVFAEVVVGCHVPEGGEDDEVDVGADGEDVVPAALGVGVAPD